MPVSGWAGMYAVSDAGRVKSLARVTMRKNGHPISVGQKILKAGTGPNGYPLVVLSKPNSRTSRTVHSLVADAFLARPSESHEVDHRNGDRSDPSLKNLRWATRSQNNGNSKKTRGASIYKGVVAGPGKKWTARIAHKHIGCFATEAAAARAYDCAAIKKFGDFAKTNFPTKEGFSL